MTESNIPERNDVEVEESDLGLGLGLRPGSLPSFRRSLPLFSGSVDDVPCSTPILHSFPAYSYTDIADTDTHATKRQWGPLQRLSEKLGFGGKRKVTENGSSSLDPVESLVSKDNSLCDVAIGTSLRQQRQLFEQEIKEIQRRRATHNYQFDAKDISTERSCAPNMDVGTLLQQLNSAKQEAEMLRQDLELCEKQFDSKCKAIRILLQQWNISSCDQKMVADKVQENNKQLIKDLNQIQFEMEYKQSTLIQSQQTWTARFDSVCRENVELTKEISHLKQEIKKLYAEKMSICREHDELVALLNARELKHFETLSKSGHESSCTTNTNNEDIAGNGSEITTLKLAILGACQCSGDIACPCANVAAQLTQDIARQKRDMDVLHQHYEESLVTIDAYRIAFEEQLARNRSLARQLTSVWSKNDIDCTQKTEVKSKDAKMCSAKQPGGDGCSTFLPYEEVTQDAVTTLIEMVHERSEALAHQRLASRLLAHRTQQLENKLSALSDGTQISCDLTSQNTLTADVESLAQTTDTRHNDCECIVPTAVDSCVPTCLPVNGTDVNSNDNLLATSSSMNNVHTVDVVVDSVN